VTATARTRYGRSGDAHIAYQAFGEGELDLMFVPGFVSNIEHYWEMPRVPDLLRRLASFARVVLFDKRGTGLSARIGALAQPDEVLVSGTVKDLVVGAGLAFADRGEHELKGVPGTWRLFAASP
jgi:pimeloyl-ACP methyl ester carboxylesterase